MQKISKMFKRQYKKLKEGDRILLLRVPQGDLDQRDREMQCPPLLDEETGYDYRGHTARTIEKIIAKNPIVKIHEIDDNGVWYRAKVEGEFHYLTVYDDHTWIKVKRKK